MASLLVLTGPPGAGKTTLAQRLAARHALGACVAVDAFFGFLAHPVPPVRPESHAQNGAVLCAAVRAAGALVAAGYEVVLEGIVGPWFLSRLAAELAAPGVPVDYAVLRVDLARALRRATARPRDPAPADVVRQMHRAFAAPGRATRHEVAVGAAAPAALEARLERLRAAGRLRLDLAAWAVGLESGA